MQPDLMSPGHVQTFLDQLKPMEPFKVRFRKQDGTQREIPKAWLDPQGTTRKLAVPVMTDEGWKSFQVDRVIYIGRETESNVTAKQGKE